jgi:astacin
MNGSLQYLSIGDGCGSVGIVAHEFIHALGFWHTQCRSDRDEYVYIDKSAMHAQMAYNFLKLKEEDNTLYTPYEYGSSMHYGSKFYSANGQHTIIPKDSKYLVSMGNGQITFYDIKMINDYYGCSDKCPAATSAKCQNGGVPNPNNCKTCNCPNGYAGALCNQMPAPKGGCGAELTATTAWKSKAFEYGEYSETMRIAFIECHHWIKAPAGSKIQVRITKGYNTYCANGCPFQGIELKLKDQRMTNPRTCCVDPAVIYTSELNPLPVIAYNRNNKTRFTIKYRYYEGSGTPRPRVIRRICADTSPECDARVRKGFCANRVEKFQYTKVHCAKSCNLCKQKANPCIDLDDENTCSEYKSAGHCKGRNTREMYGAEYYCAATCGFCENPN